MGDLPPGILQEVNVVHVPALGEQSVNFTKIGIINNLSYTLPRLIPTSFALCSWVRLLQKDGGQGTSGQVYLPTEIQQMLKDSGKVRIQILGG